MKMALPLEIDEAVSHPVVLHEGGGECDLKVAAKGEHEVLAGVGKIDRVEVDRYEPSDGGPN